MKLEDYLEQIQSSESMFAMDSFELPKKKKIIRKYLAPRHLGEQNKHELQSGIHRAMIDFDGTIYDDPSEDVKEGAKEVIDWLKSKAYEIVIFTSRASKTNALENGGDSKKEILKVESWLKDNDIYYDLITAEKLAANFYIDDRAIHYDNNWDAVKSEITKRMNL